MAPRADALTAEKYLEYAYKKVKAEDTSAAIILFTKAFEKLKQQGKPIPATHLDYRASCFEKEKEYDKALRDALTITQLYQRDIKGYLRAGKIYQLKKEDVEAMRVYKVGLEKVPESHRLTNLMKEMYAQVESRVKRAKKLAVVSTDAAQSRRVSIDEKRELEGCAQAGSGHSRQTSGSHSRQPSGGRARQISGGHSRQTSGGHSRQTSGSHSRQTSRTGSLPPQRPPIDLLQLLPLELVEQVFSHLPFEDILRLQTVCRSWRQYIAYTPQLWSRVDFRSCQRQWISAQTLQLYLSRAHGGTTELHLRRVRSSAVDRVSSIISERCTQNRLRVLTADAMCQPFASPSPGLVWERFDSLRTLRLALAYNNSVMSEVIVNGRFPSLQTLHLYAVEPTDRFLNTRIPIDLFHPVRLATRRGAKLVQNANLQHLVLDARFINVNLPPDFGLLVALWPNLRTLWLLRCFIGTDDSAEMRISIDKSCPIRLMLHETNKQLLDLNLSGSILHAMPSLPPSCQKLVLSKAEGPGAIPRWLETESEGGERVGYSSVQVLEDEDPYDVVQDEYKGLRHLDLSYGGERLTSEVFVNVLQRVDGTRLTRLDIQSCSRLETDVVDRIVELAPHLRILLIGLNSWLKDDSLATLHRLRELEYLDISSTYVAFIGIVCLLGGPDRDRDGKRISMAALTSRIEGMYGIEQHRRMDGRRRLRTLVMNGCERVSVDVGRWVRGLGVTVEHDISGMYEYGQKRRRVQ
ncbi:hypothetical protein BZA70DRAFT_147891 [Myxozyma melibiosi]|uniref:F-box domain-containing protein n=1 Tax=Myxozyma melibiosi TaxID=54550 RepID=A0ABR1F9T4_9ASCO